MVFHEVGLCLVHVHKDIDVGSHHEEEWKTNQPNGEKESVGVACLTVPNAL